jgi:copper chaperone NosL
MKKLVLSLFVGALLCAATDSFIGKSVMELKDENTTCVVRFTDVKTKKDSQFAAIMVYKDGKKEFYSSTKYMFRYYYGQEKNVSSIFVTDYKTSKFIAPQNAYFVFGSRIMSTGGDDLIVFANEADAKEFSAKNSGKRVLKFQNISKKLIELLDMK